ncbi:hypothetical protein CFC21_044017 [Triticum aestivum]|uniref:Uncharacterized protein n=2 Tax=Triticum aestivum TaxID=4565 RepID=A0A3B6FW40_WHEAT|nr:hypothetical protein CFC21_044017 [Triticum aestivum]
MAEAAIAGVDPLLRDLPDEVVIWEILVRLDPKSLLRCRAVRRAWRRATSTRRFLLAHPIATGQDQGDSRFYRSILTFDHWAADAQLQHVTRLDDPFSRLEASCDGLILLRSYDTTYFSICNPATRQCARLPIPSDFIVYGMYPHHPSGEYRILLYDENPEKSGDDACYIFVVGSVQPPRNIRWQPEARDACYGNGEAVLLRGNLHWSVNPVEVGSNTIVVFDTTAESFRAMRAPVALFVPCYNHLFEIDGVLGMYSYGHTATTINIWVLPDYESEVTTLKCRIDLLVTEIEGLCGNYQSSRYVVVLPGNGDLFVLGRFGDCLQHN